MKSRFFAVLVSVVLFTGVSVQMNASDGCYICSSGGPCQQCKYFGSDTFDARKKCEKAGCKVSGTTSCSTAANVKVCTARANMDLNEMIACEGKRK
ncbi:MAG: hypothetical protein K8R21_07995 [Leptospira sp.]|nr:hypothetical protein [Leptospira sp.]